MNGEKEHRIGENSPFVGIGWYKQDEWMILLKCSINRSDLPDNYYEWEEDANKRFQKINDMGVNVHKIPIGVSELVNWCEEVSLPVNELARNLFLAIKIQRIFDSSEEIIPRPIRSCD